MFADLVGATSSFLQQLPSFLQLFLTLYTVDAYLFELQLSFCVSVTFLCCFHSFHKFVLTLLKTILWIGLRLLVFPFLLGVFVCFVAFSFLFVLLLHNTPIFSPLLLHMMLKKHHNYLCQLATVFVRWHASKNMSCSSICNSLCPFFVPPP